METKDYIVDTKNYFEEEYKIPVKRIRDTPFHIGSEVSFPQGSRHVWTPPTEKTTCPVQKKTRAGTLWETKLNKLMASLSDKDKFAVDIGSNIGVHAVSMRDFSKGIIAVEPQKAIFKGLKKTMKHNFPDGNNYLFNDLLSDTSGEEVVFYQDNTGRSRIPIEGEKYQSGHWEKVTKKTREFDDIVEEVEGKLKEPIKIGLMKIDVEGHEFPVLRGASKTISKHRPIILIEVFDKNKEQLEKWVQENKYNLESISKVGDYILRPIRKIKIKKKDDTK
mgnify:CR=1 FL=1